jgi:hypothetical protein
MEARRGGIGDDGTRRLTFIFKDVCRTTPVRVAINGIWPKGGLGQLRVFTLGDP